MSEPDLLDLTPPPPQLLDGGGDPGGLAPIITGPPGDPAGPPIEAAEAVAAGQPIAVGNDGRVRLARADDIGLAKVLGLALGDAASGHTTRPRLGYVTLADWIAVTGASALAAGQLYFLDATTPGRLSTIAPTATGLACVRVGLAVAPDTLAVDPLSIQL